MRKELIILPLVFGLSLSACQKETQITPPMNTEVETAKTVDITLDELKTKGIALITEMKQFKDLNGYHLEEIETTPAKCLECYTVLYEFRTRNNDGKNDGTAQASFNINQQTISDVKISQIEKEVDAGPKSDLSDQVNN